MKPDKIYIPAEWMGVPKNIFDTEPSTGATEYIRKDALLEWAKDKQYESLTIHTYNFWQEVIDKLNEMPKRVTSCEGYSRGEEKNLR